MKNYIKQTLQPMRPYVEGEDLAAQGVSVWDGDTPEVGGMVAVNPKDPNDKWYINKAFFEVNYVVAGAEANTLVRLDDMTFSEAIDACKQGALISRRGWNGKDMFVFLVDGSNFVVNRAPLLGIFEEGTPIKYRPHFDMKYADGSIGVWLASHGDMNEDDWFVVAD